MMATKYTYSINTNFPNHAVNLDKFTIEITESAITGTFKHIIAAGDVCDIWFEADLSGGDLTILNGLVAAHDGQAPVFTPDEDDYWLRNLPMTDPLTEKTASASIMSDWVFRRELYNDTDNPIYVEGFKPILGASGWAEEHAARIANVENIHAKMGWHQQQVIQARYSRPKDLLIFYGWPSAYNSGDNQWTLEKVSQDMARFDLIIFGAGLEEPTHGDYANLVSIVARLKALKPSILLFGYLDTTAALSTFQDKVTKWNTAGVHGIFMDKAGYDWGTYRADFNTRVTYVHGKTVANTVMANAWNLDHIIGTVNDASYPNSTYNSSAVESALTANDWVLMESLGCNTSVIGEGPGQYPNGYEPKAQWAARVVKAIARRATYGINLAGVGVIQNAYGSGTAMFQFAFIAALMASLEAFGSSDEDYGAGDSAVQRWARPDASHVGLVYSLGPSIQVDALDANKYHRYVELAKLTLDFTIGAQTSSVNRW